MNTNNITKSPTAMSEKPLHRGRGWGGSPNPIKNREAFFDYLEEGLQGYFDNHDRLYGGVLHLTVGVREGQVGGIIKSEQLLHYSGFTLDRVKTILAYVLPRFVPRTEVALAVDAVIEELRMDKTPSNSPSMGRTRASRKQNTKQSTLNTKQATTNTESHEQEETEQQAQ